MGQYRQRIQQHIGKLAVWMWNQTVACLPYQAWAYRF
jgi:hypothetical protein